MPSIINYQACDKTLALSLKYTNSNDLCVTDKERKEWFASFTPIAIE